MEMAKFRPHVDPKPLNTRRLLPVVRDAVETCRQTIQATSGSGVTFPNVGQKCKLRKFQTSISPPNRGAIPWE